MSEFDISEAASALGAQGWKIFPARFDENGAKKSYKSAQFSGGEAWGATRDLAQIEADFRKWPDAGIGIPTGPDNSVWVLEADTPQGHDVDGIASLRALEAEHGELPATLTAMSPSGSVHRYFRWPSLAEGETIPNSAGTLAPGVDVRGAGGMVIAPPTLRPDKGAYCWVAVLPVADAPAWLIERVVKKKSDKLDVPASDGAIPRYRFEDVVGLARFLDQQRQFAEYEEWWKFGAACVHDQGEAEGAKAFAVAHDPSVTAATLATKLRSFDNGGTPVTLRTYMKRAHELGWQGRLSETVQWMFRPEALAKAAAQQVELWPESVPFIGPVAPPAWENEKHLSLEDFYACLPSGDFIFVPTRAHWPATSVNSTLPPVETMSTKPILAGTWLNRNRAVHQIVWWPGKPMVIEDGFVEADTFVSRPGFRAFNSYQPPTIEPQEGDVTPWLQLVFCLFGDDAKYFVYWCAHRTQRPWEKPCAIVLGGDQGIGKDSIIEPIRHAVGPTNCQEIAPKDLFEQFNPYVKSVLLRVSEARDMGDVNRYGLYEATKTLTASPPTILTVNEKHAKQYQALNCCGVVFTTNHADGLYLPPGDRRHFVMWSARVKENFAPGYWLTYHQWLVDGGNAFVADYLRRLDISQFDAKAPPPQTQAWREMVDAGRSPEASELSTILESLNWPDAVTIDRIAFQAPLVIGDEFALWIRKRDNRRTLRHLFRDVGYVAVKNPTASDGRFEVARRRQVVYARRELSVQSQIAAARALNTGGTGSSGST